MNKCASVIIPPLCFMLWHNEMTPHPSKWKMHFTFFAWWVCYQTIHTERSSPSSTLLCHQIGPNGEKSSSAWRWARPHPGGDTRGICHSILVFQSTELHLPGPKLFPESNETAWRRWCWHMSQAYLSQTQWKCNQNIIQPSAWRCWRRLYNLLLYFKWYVVFIFKVQHVDLWLPGCWQHMWHFSFMETPGQSHCSRSCFTQRDSAQIFEETETPMMRDNEEFRRTVGK